MSDLSYEDLLRTVDLAAQIHGDLLAKGGGPVAHILKRARGEAAEALAALIVVDPTQVEEIRKLQNEVNRYRDLVRFLSDAVSAGLEAETMLSKEDREDLLETLGLTENPDS